MVNNLLTDHFSQLQTGVSVTPTGPLYRRPPPVPLVPKKNYLGDPSPRFS